MLFLKQPPILLFLFHKSATTGQIDLYKVCVKAKIIESMAPPQQKHKRAQIFGTYPVQKSIFCEMPDNGPKTHDETVNELVKSSSGSRAV